MKLVDEEEGEIARHARRVEIFGEDKEHQDEKRPVFAAARDRRVGLWSRYVVTHLVGQTGAVPVAHTQQENGGEDGSKGKPRDGTLTEGQHYGSSEQRTEGGATVATHLEDALGKTLPAARCHLRHTRRLRMEHRGAYAYHSDRQKDEGIA